MVYVIPLPGRVHQVYNGFSALVDRREKQFQKWSLSIWAHFLETKDVHLKSVNE